MEGKSLGSKMKKVTEQFYVDKSKELGKGNFGTVYKGYHLNYNRIIAVKFIDKKTLAKFPDYEREIAVMQDLAKINHPHIMGYYGFEDNEEGLFCFIEFCNGGSLKDLIKHKMSELKVLKLFSQMLDAMTYINQQNKVHRDLKPDNILLDQNEEVKIADFGLARDVEAKMTKGVCTPLYAAPEVLKLDPYNEKCDVWSAGLILYEMLTSREMFEHVKKKVQLMKEVESFKSPEKKIKMPEGYNQRWQKIILKMMTHDMNLRPNFKELKAYFESIEQDLKNELIAKYGQQKNGLDDEDRELRLTKSINPYHRQNKGNNNLADMAKKLEEEHSFTKFNNLRKWLHFSRQRADIMVKLIKQFNKCQYAYIKNVNKYILMFLSVSTYISRIQELFNQVNSKRIKTPDGEVSESDIVDAHMPQFKQLIKQSSSKLQNTISKYKSVLQKQINAKIIGTYMQRQQQLQIICAIPNLKDLLNLAKEGTYKSQQNYLSIYKSIMNANGIHFAGNILKQFKYEDLRVYTYIRLIGMLDEMFVDTYYKNQDYLRSKKQQIENADKAELLEIISKMN